MAKRRGRPSRDYTFEDVLQGLGRDAVIAHAWSAAYADARAAGLSERAAKGQATREVAKAQRVSPRQVQTLKARFNSARAQLAQSTVRTARTAGFAALSELRNNILTLHLDKFYDGDLQIGLRITRRLLEGVKALDKMESLEAENRKLRTQLAAERAWRSPASVGSTKRK